MNDLQLQPVSAPIDDPVVQRAMIPLINRIRAMGIALPGRGKLSAVTPQTLKLVLDGARRVGIGRDISHYVNAVPEAIGGDPHEAARLIRELTHAIEESPVPETEWGSMRAIFGDDELEPLLGASRQSIQRYAKRERDTPAAIADRLHWLALVVADLAGAYNEFGIRRWFHRKRDALAGRTPLTVLGREWASDDDSARAVRALAAGLADLGAT